MLTAHNFFKCFLKRDAMNKARNLTSLMVQMEMDAVAQAKIKAFVEFTDDDARALKELLPLITKHADSIVRQFYTNIQKYPELMDIISRAGSTIERLSISQKQYVISLFNGEYGESYFAQRLTIGSMHTRIGLTPRWYLGSYSIYLRAITPLIMRKFTFNLVKRHRALSALYKIIAIDTELVIETYNRKLWDGQLIDYVGQITALNRSQAVIEFSNDGVIITANPNFLAIMGYTLDEIVGRHHRIFVDSAYANSIEYQKFWEKLLRGEYDAGEYKRIGKGGREVWLQSSYNPILHEDGSVIKVIKYATDITTQRNKEIAFKEQVLNFSNLMKNVAEGDLRQRANVHGDDDIELIATSLNTMIDSLATMASQIKESTTGMFKMLDELQTAVGAQFAGASEQAAAVNETTTTLEEIKVASTQTLEKAQQLIEIANRTRQEGEQGIETVSDAVQGIESVREQMENIAQTILALSEQTQQVGEITSVVTNLAQQSKMLALNASIEAAKAGEAGKGFAVVAAEVKELAEQSQQSTAQVQKILQDIRHATDRAVMATEEGQKGVDAGVLLVQKSGEVMSKLGAVIHEAGIAHQQIVMAVRQEVAGIEQTNAAMGDINKVTSHFVKSTEQTKNASTQLSMFAEKLKSTVAVYRLEHEEAGSTGQE